MKEYQRLVGSLQYLTLTLLDVQFAINKLAQYMQAPTPLHWTTLKKVLWYFSGTQTIVITLAKVLDFDITRYYDSDWGGDTTNRKSQKGMLIYIDQMLVAWPSRKQVTLARSSIEAEYRAIASTVEEMEAIRNLLKELWPPASSPLKLFSDNQWVMFVANNPVCPTKLRHVAMDLHFVRERTEQGSLIIKHIHRIHQKTNILTKALQPKPFQDILVGAYWL